MPEFEWQFTLVLLTNGIMIGLMYALIALGFVLIYKATDAINFAQGEFVMFAGFLAAVAAEMAGMPFWLSSLVAIAGMVALGFGLERVVLRPLIGRPVIAVVMATIGLAAVLRGTAVMAFGAGTRAIVMPVSDEPFQLGPVMLPPVQLVGAGVSLVFLALFTWFFLKSRTGIAMRAVADSQQVAMAMGINVRRYFALAWAMAGIVSALGGVVWGTMLGVDNQLALVGLKAKADHPVTALTIPDRKRLEVARAVATRPQLLLLDEVMAGLNNVEIDEALDMVRAVHATGVTVLLIEHVMRVIVGVCRRAVVLDFGQVLAEGEPEVVLRDERVIKAYLGERYAKRLQS